MSVKVFTNEQLTASDTNTFLANAGLVAIVPSSVTSGTITSGTASATANAAVASITLNGVFSSTYDSYRIVISNLTTSVTSGLSIWAKMHDGTNPANTAYNYGVPRVDMAAGTVSAWYAQGGTNGVQVCTSTGDKVGWAFDVVNPFIANSTLFVGIGASQQSGGYTGSGAGMHQTATSYSGIQFLPSSGTITGGTFTVYGYRK